MWGSEKLEVGEGCSRGERDEDGKGVFLECGGFWERIKIYVGKWGRGG